MSLYCVYSQSSEFSSRGHRRHAALLLDLGSGTRFVLAAWSESRSQCDLWETYQSRQLLRRRHGHGFGISRRAEDRQLHHQDRTTASASREHHAPAPAVENVPYPYTFTASGYPPLTWNESNPLPSGLLFNTSAGAISGTPTATGSFTFSVTATDQFQLSSTAVSFTIVVAQHGFYQTSNLTNVRYLQTATLLGAGKVLVVGGQYNATALLNATELLDPSSGTFASTGSTQISLSAHTATLLGTSATSKLLIAGGQTGTDGNATPTAELYDPTAATFSATTGNLQTARFDHTATLRNNGKVLLTGGIDATAAALASAELFDPVSGAFSATGSMQTARVGHTATLLPNGMLLVTGGALANTKVLSSAELYNPATGAFTTVIGVMTVTRIGHTATLLSNGKVLLAGGADEIGKARNTAEIFDPSNSSFIATTNMVSAHASHTATLLNDHTGLLGGGVDATGAATSVAEIFDSVAGSFAATGSLVVARE